MAIGQGIRVRFLLLFLLQCLYASAAWKYSDKKKYPNVPDYGPQPNPPYMVDNTHNYYKVAPDKGKQNGPVWAYSGSHEKFVSNLRAGKVMRGGFRNKTRPTLTSFDTTQKSKRQSSSYWLTDLAPMGSQPRAGSGYEFYRNVLDFGADNSGESDTTEAINAAVADGNRCGEECGNTFTLGAIVFFPPGTYKVCSPIIQLYYTQFIGDPNDPPTILGCDEFKGIGLIDTDPYIPGGNGANWYVNQNQFFRQIRNFIFDLTEMPESTNDNDQPLVPTGIHWQVSQATSLQNLVFNMPEASDDHNTTAVGIFTENGSGGFVSDLTFNGGNIGWRAGSQQYTAHNLKFRNCLTAVQMIWDWGWVWQRVDISGGAIAFNISGVGGDTGQGIGSISVVDSTISNVPVGILTNKNPSSPHIVLDNVEMNGVERAVQVDNGDTLLTASGTVELWTTGKVYKGDEGSDVTGSVETPAKGSSLLSDGKLYVRPRPQYESYSASQFSIATTDGGCNNDGTSDQTECLNAFLRNAVASQLIAYFPAGIYQVGGTVLIPTGSRVVGASWSQIQGTGYYFSNMADPKVVVRVGNPGDVGTMEISDMLFTVRGNTAGAVVLEWNVAAVSQGAAGMWDSHIRVGGGTGTELDVKNCPKRGFSDQCIAASLMMHVTKKSSGYFENVWVWTADHDNDVSVYDSPDKLSSQISIYCARGLLVESQGPSWFYGGGSEHSVMYNYLLSGAKDIYLGHIQTETPYFQPEPIAPQPFTVAASFPGDPDFSSCNGDTACASAWGMLIVDSTSVTVHGAGLYSFFQNYWQDCLETNDCQQRILRVTGSKDIVILNLFTVAISDIAMGIDKTVLRRDDNQRGFTTEVSIWLPLDGADNINTIFVGTQIWTSTTVTCSDSSCLLVFPTSSLSNSATISPSPYTTSFEYGDTSTVTSNGVVTVTFITTTTTTVLDIPPITVGGIPYSNYNITSGQFTIDVSPSVDLPPVTIPLPDGDGGTTSRAVPLPPWPLINGGPTASNTIPVSSGGNTPGGSGTYYTGVRSTVTITGSTVTTISFPAAVTPTTLSCPPDDSVVFETPATTIYIQCPTPTTWAIGFNCPTTKVVTFLTPTTGVVSVDCSLVTLFTTTTTTTDDPTTTPTSSTDIILPVWTTWPPGVIYPISTMVDKPEPTDGGTKQPCTLWFFFICIRRGNLEIGGWFWSYPPGIYPPGPPPGIRWPPGFSLEGTLPPWPPITIGPNGELTYSEEPTECTTTQTASICSTTTTFSVTSSDTFISTTATATNTDCETISGCSVSYSNTAIETDTVTACTVSPTGAAVAAANNDSPLKGRADDCREVSVVIYPRDPTNNAEIQQIELELVNHNHRRIQSTQLGYTAFIWVQSLPKDVRDRLALLVAVDDIYDYKDWNAQRIPQAGPILSVLPPNEKMAAIANSVHFLEDEPVLLSRDLLHSDNETLADVPAADKTQLRRRAVTTAVASGLYNDALISLPPGQIWRQRNTMGRGGVIGQNFQYYYDDSAGSGITVYAIGEVDVSTGHPEWSGKMPPRRLDRQTDYGSTPIDDAQLSLHGTRVAAVINGDMLGVCKKCEVVYSGYRAPQQENSDPRDWFLEDLLSAFDDMNKGGRTPASSVINLSWGSKFNFWTPRFIARLYDILKRMDRAGVTIVVAAGNWGITDNPNILGTKRKAIDTYPQLFGNPGNTQNSVYRDTSDPNDLGYLPNMIIVGATDQYGKEAGISQTGSFLTTHALGYEAYAVNSGNGFETARGTSFAAPQVAALAAYLKALPSQWQNQLNQANSNGPKAVKAMILALQRGITTAANAPNNGPAVPLVWNGIDQQANCLLNFPQGGDPKGVCPTLTDDITDYTPPASCGRVASAAVELAAEAALLESRSNGTMLFERQSGDFCTLPPNGGGGTQITFTTGPTIGPTCANADGCGGHVCSGYWCAPSPTGHPPGYQDPKDPNSSGATPSQTTITSGFPPGGGSSSTTPFPTLTPSECPRPWSTTSVCNGSGGNSACIETTVCPPPSNPIPTATGAPGCSESGQICLATTTYQLCARSDLPVPQGRVGILTADGAAVPSASALAAMPLNDLMPRQQVTCTNSSPRVTAQPKLPKEKRNYKLTLDRRQSGCPSGCTCFESCKPGCCATPVSYPCLDIYISGAGDFFENIWEAQITEDGSTVCAAAFSCDGCQGLLDWTDCGDGNQWKWTTNHLWYYSSKYDATYEYIVEEVAEVVYGCGLVLPVFDCTSYIFSETQGPCQKTAGKKRMALPTAMVS
ncbi:pectate lyase superfamily protein-domain-containing protein [Xylaria digitata]|nr:pectate lyase superfamily protein-domain-containing protein [Xylaria digitata]